jgi:Mg2+ and Co2+ transporter CorA
MSTTNGPININDQYEGVVNMLTEIENCQKDLENINNSLLQATENTCSQYGDRVLENLQSKLFYLQRVLRLSTRTLTKHEEVLKEAIKGPLSKRKKEFEEYYQYCQKSAAKIRLKLSKYQQETIGIITNNC